jgi:precorrin-6B methylase 2
MKRMIQIVGFLVVIVTATVASGQSAVPAPVPRPARTPDVHYEPTPQHVVVTMLDLAKVRAGDRVYDLGCGDGRIVITAVKQFGARGVCIDIDPQRILESRANARAAGVEQHIEFLTQDLFESDISGATVVTLFLWPGVNMKLRPKLWRDLKPGTRVVSYIHDMEDWPPREERTVEGARGPRKLMLWTIESGNKTTGRVK